MERIHPLEAARVKAQRVVRDGSPPLEGRIFIGLSEWPRMWQRGRISGKRSGNAEAYRAFVFSRDISYHEMKTEAFSITFRRCFLHCRIIAPPELTAAPHLMRRQQDNDAARWHNKLQHSSLRFSTVLPGCTRSLSIRNCSEPSRFVEKTRKTLAFPGVYYDKSIGRYAAPRKHSGSRSKMRSIFDVGTEPLRIIMLLRLRSVSVFVKHYTSRMTSVRSENTNTYLRLPDPR